MANHGSWLGVVELNSSQITAYNSSTDAAVDDEDKYKYMKLVSALCAVAAVLVACAISCVIYRYICKSHHSKHGVEKEQARVNSKGKIEYYDQFGCDTNELTVNSVTAITWDEKEKKPPRKWVISGSRSSGIDCDMQSSEDKPEVEINTGKRVFQVNKVSENGGRRGSGSSGKVVIRLPKGYADVGRSLQTSDGRNYTLAVIEKNSNTIHNVDWRSYRGKARVKSPLVGEEHTSPRKVRAPGGQRRKLHSTEEYTTSSSNEEMIHDSPDMPRKSKVSMSADEITAASTHSLIDKRRSSSICSKESEDYDSTTKLLSNGATSVAEVHNPL